MKINELLKNDALKKGELIDGKNFIEHWYALNKPSFSFKSETQQAVEAIQLLLDNATFKAFEPKPQSTILSQRNALLTQQHTSLQTLALAYQNSEDSAAISTLIIRILNISTPENPIDIDKENGLHWIQILIPHIQTQDVTPILEKIPQTMWDYFFSIHLHDTLCDPNPLENFWVRKAKEEVTHAQRNAICVIMKITNAREDVSDDIKRIRTYHNEGFFEKYHAVISDDSYNGGFTYQMPRGTEQNSFFSLVRSLSNDAKENRNTGGIPNGMLTYVHNDDANPAYCYQILRLNPQADTPENRNIVTTYIITNYVLMLVHATRNGSMSPGLLLKGISSFYQDKNLPEFYKEEIKISVQQSLELLLITKGWDPLRLELMVENIPNRFYDAYDHLSKALRAFHLTLKEIVLDNPRSKKILTDLLVTQLLHANQERKNLWKKRTLHIELTKNNENPLLTQLANNNPPKIQHDKTLAGLLDNMSKKYYENERDTPHQLPPQGAPNSDTLALIKYLSNIIEYRDSASFYQGGSYRKDIKKFLNDLTGTYHQTVVDLKAYKLLFVAELNINLRKAYHNMQKNVDNATIILESFELFSKVFSIKSADLDEAAQDIIKNVVNIVIQQSASQNRWINLFGSNSNDHNHNNQTAPVTSLSIN